MRLEARQLVLARGARRVIDGVDLALAPGELLCLLGPNGSGKSTLLHALTGLASPVSGEVLLDGKPIHALSPNARARARAYLPQDRAVEWRLSVRDVVALGRYPHRNGLSPLSAADLAAIDRAVALAGIADLLDRRADSLSGGEQTRVLLARAFAVDAPLLLADEPTAALDPYHQHETMAALAGLARTGAGVLAVVHDLALALRYADRVALLHQGRIVASGPPAQTLTPETLNAVYRIDALAALRGPDGVLRVS